MTLEERLGETRKLVCGGYDVEFKSVLKNQIAIMEALQQIKEELCKAKGDKK